jgi:hypothetical protein
MEKKTYYISVANGEISQIKDGSPHEFEIEATNEEIKQLREIFDDAYEADWTSFWRAHIPFLEYHNDKPNDVYDEDILQAYSIIYKLGKEETRNHIKSMGIID